MQHTHGASFIHGESIWLFHIVVSYVLATYKTKKDHLFWLSSACLEYLLLYHINALYEHVAKGESEVFSNSFILLSGCLSSVWQVSRYWDETKYYIRSWMT